MNSARCNRFARRASARRVVRVLHLALILAGLLTLQLAPWHAADHLNHADNAACGICQIAQHAGAPSTPTAPPLAPATAISVAATPASTPTTQRRQGRFARAPPLSS